MDSANGSPKFIFLGALLTFLATGLVEWLNNVHTNRNERRRYSTYARLQLHSVLQVLNKLKYSYENNNRYLPRDIKLLEKALDPLNNMRNDNTILKRSDAQESLIEVIADLNLYTTDINNLNDSDPYLPLQTSKELTEIKTPEPKEMGRKSQKVPKTSNMWLEKNIELVDLRRRIEDLVKNL